MTKNSQIKRSKLVIFKNTTNKKYMLYFIHYEKVCGFIKIYIRRSMDFAGIEVHLWDNQHKKNKIGESICIRRVYRAG